MGRIFLVRHGETQGNREKIFRGRWDLPLNDAGRVQAARLGSALATLPFSTIYTSPLSRARETAAAIAAHHQRARSVEEPALIDIDYGAWTRVSDEAVNRDYPALARQWRESPENLVFPGGEGLEDVGRRAVGFLDEIVAHPASEPLLLVSHRVTIKVILCAIVGVGNAGFWRIAVDTASVSVVLVDATGLSLQSINDTCHLQSVAEKIDVHDF